MADEDSRPLTDDERAELEALRAEKARRERAELEALRAEEAGRASAPADAAPPTQRSTAPKTATPSAQRPVTPPPARTEDSVVADDPADRTIGQRMVLSDEEDDDGIPTMPPAQKLVIAVCIVLAIIGAIYVVVTDTNMLG